MKILLTIAIAFSTTLSAFSAIIASFNFNSQPVNQPPVGLGINFGTPRVVSSFGALANQPLMLDNLFGGSSVYDQVQLNLPQMYPPALDTAFDFTSSGLIGSTAQFVVLFDTPSVRNIYFGNNGRISLHIPFGAGGNIGTFTDGEVFRISSHMDFLTHQWSIFKNGVLLATVPMRVDDYVQSIRFNYGTLGVTSGGAVAIDNIVVSTPGGPPPPPVIPTISCPSPVILECADGAVATLQVHVEEPRGNPLEVIWTVDDTPYQTNHIPSGGTTTSANVNFSANFEYGPHEVDVSVFSGTNSASCSTTVTVRDTIPPQISLGASTPAVLWPPNNKMVPVQIAAQATDNCGPATVRIVAVICNETDSSDDWKITGDLSIDLRAKRSGGGQNRTYSIALEATDAAGNRSYERVEMTVPHDQRTTAKH